MAVEIKVPEVGESITEVELGQWLKPVGAYAKPDEPLVELESEKATIELPSPAGGILTQILKQTGNTAEVGEVIGYIEAAEAPDTPAPEQKTVAATPAPEPAAPRVMPAAQRVMAEAKLSLADITPTGPGGRILKEDAQRAAQAKPASTTAVPETQPPPVVASIPLPPSTGARETRMVRMTPIRRTIAARLVEAQQNAALLTTFNELDMSAVKAMRADLQEAFQARHGVKLGFMSFFVRAAVHALQAFPAINAQIRDNDIIYYDYCDIGIAVGSGKGLVVPVLRNAETMGFAEIEQRITEFAARACDNKLAIEELQGGTFTITNGGVYGSMLSTPIINPPQSGVLGMHAIMDRPIALEGQVAIRPMMYVALTYDHRMVDGREAVTFLKAIKERIEKPALLLDF